MATSPELVDTNVLVYSLYPTAPQHMASRALLQPVYPSVRTTPALRCPVRQTSMTYGHRGLKGHPGGTLMRDGGWPLMGFSRSSRGCSMRLMDSSSPQVYGC